MKCSTGGFSKPKAHASPWALPSGEAAPPSPWRRGYQPTREADRSDDARWKEERGPRRSGAGVTARPESRCCSAQTTTVMLRRPRQWLARSSPRPMAARREKPPRRAAAPKEHGDPGRHCPLGSRASYLLVSKGTLAGQGIRPTTSRPRRAPAQRERRIRRQPPRPENRCRDHSATGTATPGHEPGERPRKRRFGAAWLVALTGSR